MKLIKAILIGSLLASASQAQLVISNGDFSASALNVYGGGTIDYTGPDLDIWGTGGWDSGSSQTFAINSGRITQNDANTADDSGADGLAQTLTLSPGDAGLYELTFDYIAETTGFSIAIWTSNVAAAGFYPIDSQTPRSNANWNNNKQLLASTAFAATGNTNVTLSGPLQFTISETDDDNYPWVALTIQSNGTGDTGLSFDNFELAVVPEPSAFFFTAFASCALLHRRRRR